MAGQKTPPRQVVKRDGDRDIVLKGVVIGRGQSGDYTALIYRTDNGKYVASLTRKHITGDPDQHGVVGENAAEIATFYTREITEGSGKDRLTRKHLNEAGKLAMQDASEKEETFRDLGFEIVE